MYCSTNHLDFEHYKLNIKKEENMALDFEAIKRKLERLSGNNTSRNIMWKPEEGQEYEVRLLSFPDNDGQPFKELMFYYNIPGQRGLLAPSQFGKRDPIQELIDKLRNEGTKESYEMAKKLYPKMRVYAPVVVRGEESEGVRIWSFGKLLRWVLMLKSSALNLLVNSGLRLKYYLSESHHRCLKMQNKQKNGYLIFQMLTISSRQSLMMS